MKCPHCLVSFFPNWRGKIIWEEGLVKWITNCCMCPNCKKMIIGLLTSTRENLGGVPIPEEANTYMVWPKTIARAQLPEDVPEKFSSDYKEACLVLADSPKASAALSRRCLQYLLREIAGVKPSNLSNEIEEAMKSLPSHLAESIDAIRNLGNFAAHPMKSTNTGEVIEVEPGEAEWLLDVLEGLFDFYFVQPEKLRKKRQALDAKLKDAGKPEMKVKGGDNDGRD